MREPFYTYDNRIYLVQEYLLRIPFKEIENAIYNAFGNDFSIKGYGIRQSDWKLIIYPYTIKNIEKHLPLANSILLSRIEKGKITLLTIEEAKKKMTEIIKKVTELSHCIILRDSTLADNPPYIDIDQLFSQIPHLQKIYSKAEDTWESGGNLWDLYLRGGDKKVVRKLEDDDCACSDPFELERAIIYEWILGKDYSKYLLNTRLLRLMLKKIECLKSKNSSDAIAIITLDALLYDIRRLYESSDIPEIITFLYDKDYRHKLSPIDKAIPELLKNQKWDAIEIVEKEGDAFEFIDLVLTRENIQTFEEYIGSYKQLIEVLSPIDITPTLQKVYLDWDKFNIKLKKPPMRNIDLITPEGQFEIN
jgi:hypothetical protein